MKLQNPWPAGYSINRNSPFGWRNDPFTGKRKYHKGIDVAGSFPVTVPADGKVVHVANEWRNLTDMQKRRQSGGNVVTIQHENDLFTTYYHGDYQSKLKVGDRVKTGDFIFTAGNTGRSTGPHLHFEVRRSKSGDQVDPVPYLNGSASVVPAPLKVSGKLDSATWKAFQQALKDAGHYKGIPDGRPGTMTYRAMQEWAGVKADGIIGLQTRRAVQKRLNVKEDGIWGRNTISALQRALNEGTI